MPVLKLANAICSRRTKNEQNSIKKKKKMSFKVGNNEDDRYYDDAPTYCGGDESI